MSVNTDGLEHTDIAFEFASWVSPKFKSRITKISVEMIGENEESIIIIEKQLC